jgi:ketosteroid isomerase-like protein
MKIDQIAKRLVELCRRGDHLGAQRELFAPDAVSIEPDATPEAVTRGLDRIHGKAKAFDDMFEVHRTEIGEPIVAGDFFACTMTVDVTDRKSQGRMTLTEICVYEVKDGKIVREQFFFRPSGK